MDLTKEPRYPRPIRATNEKGATHRYERIDVGLHKCLDVAKIQVLRQLRYRISVDRGPNIEVPDWSVGVIAGKPHEGISKFDSQYWPKADVCLGELQFTGGILGYVVAVEAIRYCG